MKFYKAISRIVIFCCVVLTLWHCSTERIDEYDLDTFINKIKIDPKDSIVRIDLCEIIPAEWDSILVVKSYTAISQQKLLTELDNYSSLKPKIEYIRSTDFYNYLVFVKNNRAVGFGKVTPTPIQFANFPIADPSGSPSVGVLSKSNCDKLFMGKNGVLIITDSLAK